MQLDFTMQISEITGDTLLIASDDLVAAAVIAKCLAKRDVYVY